MGKRGPQKTPTEVLKRRGSRRAKEPARVAEVKAAGEPVCPTWLDPAARDCWTWLAGELKTLRLLAAIDANTLARYCRTWSRWQRCQAVLIQHGETYVAIGSTGQESIKKRPEVEICARLATELATLEGALGLSPAARAGRVAPPKANDEPADALESLKLFGAKTA